MDIEFNLLKRNLRYQSPESHLRLNLLNRRLGDHLSFALRYPVFSLSRYIKYFDRTSMPGTLTLSGKLTHRTYSKFFSSRYKTSTYSGSCRLRGYSYDGLNTLSQCS